MRQILIAGVLMSLSAFGCIPGATATPILENPPACSGAQFVYHAGLQELLLTGCVPGTINADGPSVVWGWNGQQWRRVTSGGPHSLVLGGAAYDEGRDVLVLYGGLSLTTGECARETWEWEGEAWSMVEASPPTACDHLEMVYDSSGEQTILFGGGNEDRELARETWAWDGKTWTLISQDGPPGRAHFGFTYDPLHDQILMYGGYTGSILEDFWARVDGTWKEIDFPGPGRRSHFGMSIDPNTVGLLIFGGATRSHTFSSLSNSTWLLTGGHWSELELSTAPSARGSPAMAADPARSRVVLYGGFDADGNELNDTWEWDGSRWRCILQCD